MKSSERGWVRGALVIGIAGTMMAVALLSPALAVRLATTGYVKSKVNGLRSDLQGQINAESSTLRGQSFGRTSAFFVPTGSNVAAEIGCPAGMIVTGGGVYVDSAAILVNASNPTDGTGSFASSFGASGAGMNGWGVIVGEYLGGSGNARVYASCRTGFQTGSNYTSGSPAIRADGSGDWRVWTNDDDSSYSRPEA